MSRRYLLILLLFPFLVLPYTGISQTILDSNSELIVKISNGEIRDYNSRKLGSIASEGTVRNYSSKKLGIVKDYRVVNANGQTIFKYDDAGTVRDKNGRLIYRINNGDIRDTPSRLLLVKATDLFQFIDSDQFQIHIYGHSCGITDRTLLREVFQYENCKSTKIYYHKRKDKTTDFTEKIIDIYRHFTDKSLARKKIVPFQLCEAMPQHKK